MPRSIGSCGMPDFSVSTTQTLTLLQNTPFAEICPTSSKIETDDVRSTESQGGKEAEAHQGWRKQAKSREEESGYRGTDLTVEYGFGIPRNIVVYSSLFCSPSRLLRTSENPCTIHVVSEVAPTSWRAVGPLGITLNATFRFHSVKPECIKRFQVSQLQFMSVISLPAYDDLSTLMHYPLLHSLKGDTWVFLLAAFFKTIYL